MEREFVCLIEHNDWEGETWRFYFPSGGNNEAINFLKDKIKENEFYEIQEGFKESEVDILVKHSECGYMYNHNKYDIVLDVEKLKKKNWSFEEFDPLYKGNLKEYVKGEK